MNKEKNNELEEIKWAGVLNEFLWTCAGVNKKILRQCPTDYAKYAGIGGTILFTALMAMLSGGYALSTVFKVDSGEINWLAIGFGIFWGLLIFNLDRFIVNTMYSDGKASISWFEFFAGLPRIIMAVFLGIVISTPLELKIFESEINVELDNLMKDEIAEYVKEDKQELEIKEHELEDLRNSPITTTFDAHTGNANIDKLIDDKSSKIQQHALIVANRQNAWKNYQSTRNDSTKIVQCNQYYQQYTKLKNRAKALNAEINNINGKINALKGTIDNANQTAQTKRDIEINRLQSDIDTLKVRIENGEIEHRAKVEDNYGGFQGRMLAFGRLKEKHTTTELSALFIMLLFIILKPHQHSSR